MILGNSISCNLDEGMNRRNRVDALMVIQIGELHEEEELFDFDLVFFAVEGYDLFVQGVGDADGGAACCQDVIEESEIERVAFGFARGNIAKAIEDMVCPIFLHDFHIVEVAFLEWQLAFLTNGYKVLDQLRLIEQRRSKKETTSLDRDDVRAMGMCVNIGDKLLIDILILQQGQNIDKVDTRLGEVWIMVDIINVVHILCY